MGTNGLTSVVSSFTCISENWHYPKIEISMHDINMIDIDRDVKQITHKNVIIFLTV